MRQPLGVLQLPEGPQDLEGLQPLELRHRRLAVPVLRLELLQRERRLPVLREPGVEPPLGQQREMPSGTRHLILLQILPLWALLRIPLAETCPSSPLEICRLSSPCPWSHLSSPCLLCLWNLLSSLSLLFPWNLLSYRL